MSPRLGFTPGWVRKEPTLWLTCRQEFNVPGQDSRQGPTGRSRWRALGALALGGIEIRLDSTVLNLALPTPGNALHASTTQLQWLSLCPGSSTARGSCRPRPLGFMVATGGYGGSGDLRLSLRPTHHGSSLADTYRSHSPACTGTTQMPPRLRGSGTSARRCWTEGEHPRTRGRNAVCQRA